MLGAASSDVSPLKGESKGMIWLVVGAVATFLGFLVSAISGFLLAGLERAAEIGQPPAPGRIPAVTILGAVGTLIIGVGFLIAPSALASQKAGRS